MKIAFLSPFFYPEIISTGKWNLQVCNELANFGELEVFCFNPFYPQWKMIPGDVPCVKGMVVTRVLRRLYFPRSIMLRRVAFEFGFFFGVLRQLAGRKSQVFDLSIVVFPPTLFMLALVRGKSRHVVAVIHDLQGVHSQAGNWFSRSVLTKVIEWVERVAFNRCDKFVFLSTDMMRLAMDLYKLERSDCSVAYPFKTIDQFTQSNQLADAFPAGLRHIVYSGAMGVKQNPEKLFDLLKAVCLADENVCVHMYSDGPYIDKYRPLITLDNFKFNSLVAEELLPELLLRSDIQIIPQASGTSMGSLPSKLPNILAAGVKIFAVTDAGSELDGLLSDVSGVVTNNSWDIDECLGKIMTLLDIEHIKCSKRGNLLKQFSIENTIQELIPDAMLTTNS